LRRPIDHGGSSDSDGDAAPVLVTASAGTVVFFLSPVLHRSGANRSDQDRRVRLYLFQPADHSPPDETRTPHG
jgi:ectoine hydroxylase-related dioxygenase (phytanoyl-CoA dioxygenase family)